MPESAPVVFASLNDFTDAFDGVQTGTSDGLWRFDAGGSTSSSNTGPGTNNSLAFVHTETSGITPDTAADAQADGIVEAAEVPDETGRSLHLRACVQGTFGDGLEGLRVEHRASGDDAWSEAGFIHGWPYSDSYQAGDEIAAEDGDMLTCAADGGWVDFEVPVPDSATQVPLAPVYIAALGNTFTHDVALRRLHWSWEAATQALALSARAGDPTLSVDLTARAAPPVPPRTGVLAAEGDRLLTGATSAAQRLRDALSIVRGSYPFARDYGSRLADVLDRPLGPSGVGEIANAVADAIAHPANGLGDVRLRSVNMAVDDGALILDVQADWVSEDGTLAPIGLREQLAAGQS